MDPIHSQYALGGMIRANSPWFAGDVGRLYLMVQEALVLMCRIKPDQGFDGHDCSEKEGGNGELVGPERSAASRYLLAVAADIHEALTGIRPIYLEL